MTVKSFSINLSTSGSGDTINITDKVRKTLFNSRIINGIVTIFVPGSTGAITTVEFEPGVIKDLNDAMERVVPEDIVYEHHLRWQDGNGHSHVRAALLGPSLTIPIIDGDLTLGTWQQIVLIDYDNVPRQRRIVVQIMGDHHE